MKVLSVVAATEQGKLSQEREGKTREVVASFDYKLKGWNWEMIFLLVAFRDDQMLSHMKRFLVSLNC